MYRAGAYLEEIVYPTVDEFLHDLNSPRRGMLASMAVLHLVDHVFQNRHAEPRVADRELERFTVEASDRDRCFRTIRMFALAAKHGRLARRFETGFESRDFKIAPAGRGGVMQAAVSHTGDPCGGVIVRGLDGEWYSLPQSIRGALAYLRRELVELQSVDEPPDMNWTALDP